MASPEAQALAQELTRQLQQHSRISLLLQPTAQIIDGEEHITLYWLDRDAAGAADAVIRVNDHAGQSPQAAA